MRPMRPVAQKAQPWRQPTCDEMHRVVRAHCSPPCGQLQRRYQYSLHLEAVRKPEKKLSSAIGCRRLESKRRNRVKRREIIHDPASSGAKANAARLFHVSTVPQCERIGAAAQLPPQIFCGWRHEVRVEV